MRFDCTAESKTWSLWHWKTCCFLLIQRFSITAKLILVTRLSSWEGCCCLDFLTFSGKICFLTYIDYILWWSSKCSSVLAIYQSILRSRFIICRRQHSRTLLTEDCFLHFLRIESSHIRNFCHLVLRQMFRIWYIFVIMVNLQRLPAQETLSQWISFLCLFLLTKVSGVTCAIKCYTDRHIHYNWDLF